MVELFSLLNSRLVEPKIDNEPTPVIDLLRLYNVSLGELRGGKVVQVTDYWGEPFTPPAWREGLAERDDELLGESGLTTD